MQGFIIIFLFSILMIYFFDLERKSYMSDDFKEFLGELYPVFVCIIFCFLVLFLISGKYINHNRKELAYYENPRYKVSTRVLPSDH